LNICENILNGVRCPYGDSCPFPHSAREAKLMRRLQEKEHDGFEIDYTEFQDAGFKSVGPPKYPTAPPPAKRVCRHFIRGHCQLGENCYFRHERPHGDGEPDYQSVAKVPCRHYLRGYCQLGDRCKFLHPVGVVRSAPPRTRPVVKELCWHFKTGKYCKMEATCKFRHHFLPGEEQSEKNDQLCWHFKKHGACNMEDKCMFRHYFKEGEKPKEDATEEESKKWLCWEWQSKGICYREADCKFRHHLLPGESGKNQVSVNRTGQDASEKAASQEQSRNRSDSKGMALCKWFLVGKCWNGDKCNYFHGKSPTSTAPTRPAGNPLPFIPCKYFKQGRCRKGDQCEFLHEGPPVCQEVPPKQPEESVKGKGICKWFILGQCWAGDKCKYLHDISLNGPSKYKTLPCKHYMKGHCLKGEKCTFIHDPEALKLLQHDESMEDPVKYRTVPCKHWVMTGDCFRGDMCKFLHQEGLQSSQSDRGDEQLCWHFKRSGHCPMGDKCKFKHELESEPATDKSDLMLFTQEGKQDVCQHYARGFCSTGEDCPFLHIMPASICKHYARGECRLGYKCLFEHPPTLRKKRPGLPISDPPPVKRRKIVHIISESPPPNIVVRKPPPPRRPISALEYPKMNFDTGDEFETEIIDLT